jgi:putrescine aminotransferase
MKNPRTSKKRLKTKTLSRRRPARSGKNHQGNGAKRLLTSKQIIESSIRQHTGMFADPGALKAAKNGSGTPGKKEEVREKKFDLIRDAVKQSCELKTKIVYDGKGFRKKMVVCAQDTREEVLHKSQEYLDIITGKKKLTPKVKKDIIRRTLENFDNFYNRGFLTYRKSVAEAEDFASLEWEGRGSIMRDLMGREYIDCLGGYGIYNMGMCHPKIVKAVKSQVERMPLSSQELLDPLRGAMAELLGQLAPGDLQECFFINNGTDAVEGALKLARLYTKRIGFISAVRGFHGKSMGSLSVMGKHTYRLPFEPLLPQIHFVPFGNVRALEEEFEKLAAVGELPAALILEPIQGEAGAIVPPPDFLPAARRLCTEYKTLLILDEVQTGFGRTGKIFACEHWNVIPDVLCLGKSIGGGVMPLSAFLSNSEIWKVLEDNPFIHSSTFGGNPLACAAGIAAINVMLEENLPEQAAQKGEFMMTRLRRLQAQYPHIMEDVHGLGLLIGMDFVSDEVGYRVAAGLFKRGVLVAGTLISSKTIRIEPALNISYDQLHVVIDKIEQTFIEISAKGVS